MSPAVGYGPPQSPSYFHESVMKALFITVGVCCVASDAHAQPSWQRNLSPGAFLGISLLGSLGPAADRSRFGVAVDATAEAIWHRSSYLDAVQNHVTPVARTSAQFGWIPARPPAPAPGSEPTTPVFFNQLTVQGGAMYPAHVADGGYIHGAGLLGGLGLGMATDGSAGPIVTGTALAPLFQARIEATRWQERWHAPRLSIGPQLPMNCCSYYQ